MSIDIYFQLLCAIAGIGFFAGLIWSMTTKNGPFSDDGFVERFAASVCTSGPAGAGFFALIYSVIWSAIRALYFGFTGL